MCIRDRVGLKIKAGADPKGDEVAALRLQGNAIKQTVAVAQGQNPLTALGITVFSAVAAVMVGQVL